MNARQIFKTVFLVALFFGWGHSALAQNVCADRTKLLESLLTKHTEKPVSMGLASNGNVIEILASPNGSWTIIGTHVSGWSCIKITGENWKTLPQIKEGSGT